MCCFHAIEHYSQHFSKKRNLVCTPFTVCNCPSWTRTNKYRSQSPVCYHFTIRQRVSCKYYCIGEFFSLQLTNHNIRKDCVLMTLTTCQIVLIILFHYLQLLQVLDKPRFFIFPFDHWEIYIVF